MNTPSPMLFFDLDGTLIDSRADLANAINAVRAAHGMPAYPLQEVVSFVGDGLRKLVTRAFPDVSDESTIDALCKEQTAEYAKRLVDCTRLYPGVAETLPRLARHYKLALVTNKPDKASRTILSELGVLQYFSSIVGGGRTTTLKPDPEGVFLALKECGGTLEGSWMVGDHRTDLGVAKNAGIKACFCSFGFGVQDKERADAVISHFALLPQVLGMA